MARPSSVSGLLFWLPAFKNAKVRLFKRECQDGVCGGMLIGVGVKRIGGFVRVRSSCSAEKGT